ncbi:DUF3261 domain-containing protein [Photobacterium japonica]|uniref:DUF3261 domain-containing protein n=1 Tax=Photobacterium japonica TaxID=2910235 RepID=UPI003D0D9CB0
MTFVCHRKRLACAVLLFITLSGCAHRDETDAASADATVNTAASDPATAGQPSGMINQVALAPNVNVTLPTPAALGESLTATQLITARWGDQQNQLPVQLEVTPDKLVLAGFSSWGARILSLTYQDHALSTDVLPGLGNVLPKPEQVLLNLMLTLWPVEAWQAPLAAVGWQLIEHPHQRQLLDNHGNVVVDIHYAASSPLDGEIVFTHRQLGYVITINTLNHRQSPQQ